MADVKKRWRAWLRAIHRDVGYLSIGFTMIYACSGIAQNHIEDWGDVSYRSSERVVALATPIAANTSDADAIATVRRATKLDGAPTETFRAGDEIRLSFAGGEKVTVVGTTVTIQERSRRVFIGAANWLHKARGKPAWKYISDIYAVLLIYLSISGLFMIKGKLGLKWRGTAFLAGGVAVPVLYVALSGGPGAPEPADEPAPKKIAQPMPTIVMPDAPTVEEPVPEGSAILKPLPPDDEE